MQSLFPYRGKGVEYTQIQASCLKHGAVQGLCAKGSNRKGFTEFKVVEVCGVNLNDSINKST